MDAKHLLPKKLYCTAKNIFILLAISLFLNSCQSESEIPIEDLAEQSQNQPKPISNIPLDKIDGKITNIKSEDSLLWKNYYSNRSYFTQEEGNIYEKSASGNTLGSYKHVFNDDYYSYGYDYKNKLHLALPTNKNSSQWAISYTSANFGASWELKEYVYFMIPEPKVKWKMLTLVVKNLNVKLDNSIEKVTMSQDLVNQHVSIAKQIPSVMSSWTDGKANVSMEVKVIEDEVTSLDEYGTGYWPGPASLEDILDKYAPQGTYSSITIAVDMGSIPKTWGGLGYYPGPDFANGAIYSVMSFPEVSGFIHEWLHGAGGWYRSKGFDVPDPHDNSKYGHPETTNGTWDYWYKDLMNGTIKASENSKPSGYTLPVWNYPGPGVDL